MGFCFVLVFVVILNITKGKTHRFRKNGIIYLLKVFGFKKFIFVNDDDYSLICVICNSLQSKRRFETRFDLSKYKLFV